MVTLRSFLPTLVVAAVALQGCNRTPAAPVDPATPAMLEVENQAFNDMTIYVVRSGMRWRLGTVGGNSKAVFEIPRTMVNPGIPIRFQADPIGGNRAPVSQEIAVGPGETVVLRIPPG
jgi:hypothetical protein